MENKTLSVIIPNYNKSTYIQETIESILSQSFRPKEIIIVDDCSTDVSKEIIKQYELKYPYIIKAFYFETNQGVQKARTFGVLNATGKYITFIDSDDFYYNPYKLEKEMELAGPKRIVYSSYCFFDNVSKVFIFPKKHKKYFRFFKHNQIYCYVNMKYMSSWPFAFIVEKETFNKIGGYNFPFDYFEDLDLLIRYSKYGLKPYLLNQYGMAIRTNATDVSHLSKQGDKYPNVKEILNDRYGNDISVMNILYGKVFDLLEKVKGKFKKIIRIFI